MPVQKVYIYICDYCGKQAVNNTYGVPKDWLYFDPGKSIEVSLNKYGQQYSVPNYIVYFCGIDCRESWKNDIL